MLLINRGWQSRLPSGFELSGYAEGLVLPQSKGWKWICDKGSDCATGMWAKVLKKIMHLCKSWKMVSKIKQNWWDICTFRYIILWVHWPNPSMKGCSCGWSYVSTRCWTPNRPDSSSSVCWTLLDLKSLMYVIYVFKLLVLYLKFDIFMFFFILNNMQ